MSRLVKLPSTRWLRAGHEHNFLWQTNELVKKFHQCVIENRDYEEEDWDSLMELPPHSSRRQHSGSGSQQSPSKTMQASSSLQQCVTKTFLAVASR